MAAKIAFGSVLKVIFFYFRYLQIWVQFLQPTISQIFVDMQILVETVFDSITILVIFRSQEKLTKQLLLHSIPIIGVVTKY